jgi:hypothetical protein
MDMKFLLAAIITVMLGASSAWAADLQSIDYAKLGGKFFSIVKCQYYSSYLKKEEESRRLGKLGMETGRTFFEAANAGKINKEDWRQNVPIFLGWMSGPSIDFILGKTWQYIENDSNEELEKELSEGGCEDCKWDKRLREMRLQRYYRESNCELIK